MSMSFKTATEAFADGERRDRAGDPTGALEAFRAALRLDRDHGEAANYAGWLLTTRLRDRPGAIGEGIDLLRRAIEAMPDDTRPLYNFGEACASLGQPQQAMPAIEAALARRPDWAELFNLRAWLTGVKGDDPKAALIDLDAALRLRSWYGDAHLNRGRVLIKLGEYEQAEDAYETALRSQCFRPAEAHYRLGALAERRGHLRRALGHYRRAIDLGAGDLTDEASQSVQRCGTALLTRGAFFLHAVDDNFRARDEPDEQPRPRALAELVARAQHELAAIPEQPDDVPISAGRAGLMAAESCFKGQQLEPRWADQSPAVALELMATSFTGGRHDELRELAAEIRRAWLALHEELLEREEPPRRREDGLAAIARLGGERNFAAATAALREFATGDEPRLLGRAALAERLGDRASMFGDDAAARDLYAIAESDFSQYASWSTSGGEGMARMVDVTRLRQKLGRAPR
jgi:tetratricopeptide (TPR) repeat protein